MQKSLICEQYSPSSSNTAMSSVATVTLLLGDSAVVVNRPLDADGVRVCVALCFVINDSTRGVTTVRCPAATLPTGM